MADLIYLVIGGLFLAVLLLLWYVKRLRRSVGEHVFHKKSMSVKYGKMSEQFFPFMKDYPYKTEDFRFLGTPVDGVQFEKDRIVLLEFKTGSSALSARQKEIRELVKKGEVSFEVIRIK
jgi:predicted Holliday junction resolvase-like endonuclease